MTRPVSSLAIPGLRLLHITTLLEQGAEAAHRIGFAYVSSLAMPSLRLLHITTPLQQEPKVTYRDAVASVGAAGLRGALDRSIVLVERRLDSLAG